VRLRGFRVLAERGLVDAGHLALGDQLDTRDAEAVGRLLEVHLRLRGNPGRGEPGGPENQREGHREAARVRRGDEFLGVGAGAALEARRERVLALVRPAAEGYRAAAVLQRPLPLRL